MKKFFLMAMVSVFLMTTFLSCDEYDSDKNKVTAEEVGSLQGTWYFAIGSSIEVGGAYYSVGKFKTFVSGTTWDKIRQLGYINTGSEYFRVYYKRKENGNLIYLGEVRHYRFSSDGKLEAMFWVDCTITLHSDKQSFTLTTTDYGSATLTRTKK